MTISGDQLRHARVAANLTQEELAELMGVTLRSVGNWERLSGVPRNQEGRLRSVLGGHLGGDTPADSLTSYSDMALLAELGRRLARTGGRLDERHTEAQKNDGAGVVTAMPLAARTPRRGTPSKHQHDSQAMAGEESQDNGTDYPA